MISLVIPFLDAFDKLERCLEVAIKHAGSKDWEIVLIDNGSQNQFDYSKYSKKIPIRYIRHEENSGVLATYKEGFENATGNIICFIHSDVLLHGSQWVLRVKRAFRNDKELGLAGLFGSRGIGVDGGRSWSISNMQGKEWGKCECHAIAAWHHGEIISGVHPAVVLDGVGMFFRQEALYQLLEQTDAFADWRSMFHFYDKILSLKTIDLGWHVAVIDIEFDHWSGATANHSKKYKDSAAEWFKKRGLDYDKKNPDLSVYALAEAQMFAEYQQRFPVNVLPNYKYEWRQI